MESLENLAAATAALRDALSAPAEEVFPLGQVETSVTALRDAAAEAAAVPPPAITLGVLRALDSAQTQSELLHGLLSELTNHAARAVVLVFRPGGVSAWSAIGFDDVSRLGRVLRPRRLTAVRRPRGQPAPPRAGSPGG